MPLGARLIAALSMAAALAASGPALAADARHDFNVPSQSLKAELVSFAEQAGISVGIDNLQACAATGNAVVGRFTVREGLERLLARTGCTFRFIDPRAVAIVPLPRPAPPRPPAAQPPPPPPATTDVDQLVVVATRRPTLQASLAYPVSLVSSAELQQAGATDLAGVARLTPSMTLTNLGPGRDKILIRGLSDGPLTGRTQAMVGIYMDGLRLTYNAPDPDLLLTDVASVEVLRGPQGALYGSGSLGGVVQINTRPPDPTDYTAALSAGAGVTRGGAGSSVVTGMANLPLLSGQAGLRLVGWREEAGGYIDDPGLGARDINRTVRQGYRATLAVTLTDDWTLSLGGLHQTIDSANTQYATSDVGDYARRTRLAEPHDNDFSALYLNLQGDGGGVQSRLNLAYVRHEVDSRYDASAAPPVPVAGALAAFDDDDAISSLVGEWNLSGETGRGRWLIGGFAARTQQDIVLSLTGLDPSPATVFTERRDDQLDETALFGQAAFRLGDDWELTLGGRWFWTTGRTESRITAPGAAYSARYGGGWRDSGFAPQVVLSWRPGPWGLVYVQASEGYRGGGINTTGEPGVVFGGGGGAAPLRRFGGDELWSLELGARGAFFDNRLTLQGALFDARWRNIQSDQILPSGLPFTGNIGDGGNRGLELAASWRSGGLRMSGALLLNDPELVRPGPAFPAKSDLLLAGVARATANLQVGKTWTLGDDRQLDLDLGFAWTGRSALTFDALTTRRMGNFTDARLALAYGAGGWRVAASVENLLDDDGDTFAYGNPFTLRTSSQSTPLRPRTLQVTVTRRF